jgi:hypothetical protein
VRVVVWRIRYLVSSTLEMSVKETSVAGDAKFDFLQTTTERKLLVWQATDSG